MTQQVLSFFQIGVAVLLGIAILLQQKGAGLSGAFGGEGGFYRTKRGFEKILLVSTIILSILFVTTGIVRIFIAPNISAAPVIPGDNSFIPSFELGAEESTVPLISPEVEISGEAVPPQE